MLCYLLTYLLIYLLRNVPNVTILSTYLDVPDVTGIYLLRNVPNVTILLSTYLETYQM